MIEAKPKPTPVEHEENALLEQRVMADFYNSFTFSQKDADSQHWLMAYTARQYSPQDIAYIHEHTERFTHLVGSLTLPPRHGKVQGKASDLPKTPKDIIKQEFQQQWRIQMDFFTYTQRPINPANTYTEDITSQLEASDDALLETILHDIISNDIYYVVQGRPSRSDEARFESYFRTYGLLHTPTSPASSLYDELFLKLEAQAQHERVTTSTHHDIRQKLAELAAAWEEKHGESFYPTSETA